MTPVGHTLTGLTLGVAVLPAHWRPRAKVALLVAFGLVANGPDWQFPHWGHDRYYLSHSIFVTLALAGVVMGILAAWPAMRRRIGGWPVAIAAAAAWTSHLLLDCLYNHGLGLRLAWPLSDYRLNLALPWFEIMPGGFSHPRAARILAIEFAFYGALLAVVLAIRLVLLRRHRAARSC